MSVIRIDNRDNLINYKSIRREDKFNLPTLSLLLSGINVKVRYQRSGEVKEDIFCDSAFMIPVMDWVREAIREAYFWAAPERKICLIIPNPRGHGTNEIKTY